MHRSFGWVLGTGRISDCRGTGQARVLSSGSAFRIPHSAFRIQMLTLNRLRLRNQWLTGSTSRTPLEVVTHLGAVQSQEFGAATWAIALRAKGLRHADVVGAFDAGEIVRTHVLRPTWHFVPPADLRWMLALTGPRLQAQARTRYPALGLADDAVRRSRRSIERALGDGATLTRVELVERMRRDGLSVAGQQGYHLLFDAELAGLVCSGPLRGAQFTYALLETRVPRVAPLDRELALATLATRYFASHGPATPRDFAWWSGLRMSDVRRAIDILGASLERLELEGTTYYRVPGPVPAAPRKPLAHLLPCFDEYTVAYLDRRAVAGRTAAKGEPPGALLVDLVLVDGVRAGTWRRISHGSKPVEMTVTRRLGRTERDAVELAVDRYRAFLGR
jgi:hypothetical protein